MCKCDKYAWRSRGWHSNWLRTLSCDQGQNPSQVKNWVSQRSSPHKGPVDQESTCQTNTTIDTLSSAQEFKGWFTKSNHMHLLWSKELYCSQSDQRNALKSKVKLYFSWQSRAIQLWPWSQLVQGLFKCHPLQMLLETWNEFAYG